jgi:hypothetical protein
MKFVIFNRIWPIKMAILPHFNDTAGDIRNTSHNKWGKTKKVKVGKERVLNFWEQKQLMELKVIQYNKNMEFLWSFGNME